jgi:hypothetical protein
LLLLPIFESYVRFASLITDFLDLDIQQAELLALTDVALQSVLDGRLRRLHIGTHTPDIHSALKQFFLRKGWFLTMDLMYGMYEQRSGQSERVYLQGCGPINDIPVEMEGEGVARGWGDKYVFDSLQLNPGCTQQTR